MMGAGSFAERLAAGRCLAELASELSGIPSRSALRVFEQVTASPLVPDDWSSGGRSGLNHDGAPAQLCVGVSNGAARVRLIGDPGSHHDNPIARWQTAAQTVQLLAGDDAPEFAGILHGSFNELCGGDNDWKSRYELGPCWLAATLGEPGWALYTDTSILTHDETAARLAAVLSISGADDGPLLDFLKRIRNRMWVCSAGIEGYSASRYRVKLHLRFLQTPKQGELARAIPILDDLFLVSGVQQTLLDNRIDAFGLVLGVGFNSITGGMSDAKMDVSVAQLGLTPEDAVARLDAAASALGFVAPRALTDALAGPLRLSHLGFGRDLKGRRRLNVYAKPASRKVREQTNAA